MNTPESNPRLDYFRSMIGHDMSQSLSPLGRWLNGILRAADYGTLTMEYTVREEMGNAMHTLHGGTSAAILDEIIGATVFTLGREYAYVSVNLNVDFLHSAREGEVITATAQVIRAGRTIIHVEGTIRAADGKIIAKAASNMVQSSLKLP